MSFYKNLEHKFAPIPEDKRIESLIFLDACSGSILPLLDILGSTAFAMVKSDISGNIKRVRKRYTEDPAKYPTLADIIEVDVKNGTAFKGGSTTEALLWLNRALNFVCNVLKNLAAGKVKDNSIVPSLKQAYKDTLQVYHNWMVKNLVEVAFHAAPYYSDLVKSLSNGEPDDIVIQDVQEYQLCLQDQVNTVVELFVSNGLDPK
ncbi:glycolipid transfer protein-like [Asterias amurensis]|uniref:glycolipid transfer protein-like n=1 Tax=Asterias amurensis TaxID=7602 RepID=UPI003AB670E4